MRYEICMISDAKKSPDTPSDLTCLAFYVCKEILPEDIHTQSGVPLPADQKDCVCPCVAWEDLQVQAHLRCRFVQYKNAIALSEDL